MDPDLVVCLLVTEQYSEATLKLVTRSSVNPSEQTLQGLVPHLIPSGYIVAMTAASESSSGAPWSFQNTADAHDRTSRPVLPALSSIINLYKALLSWISGFNLFSS